jgi:hypothetical protein
MDKRTILAFVLIAVVILYMNTDHYRRMAGLPDPNQETVLVEDEATKPAAERPAPEPTGTDTLQTLSAAPVSTDALAGTADTTARTLLPFDGPQRPEQLLTVETDLYTARILHTGRPAAQFRPQGHQVLLRRAYQPARRQPAQPESRLQRGWPERQRRRARLRDAARR